MLLLLLGFYCLLLVSLNHRELRMKILKSFKIVVIVAIILFAQTPQFCYSIGNEGLFKTCAKIAVVSSVAAFSLFACVFGLIKISHPSALITKEEKTSFITEAGRTTKVNAQGTQTNTTILVERPLFNKNEAIQGAFSLTVGLVGLTKCWSIAQ